MADTMESCCPSASSSASASASSHFSFPLNKDSEGCMDIIQSLQKFLPCKIQIKLCYAIGGQDAPRVTSNLSKFRVGLYHYTEDSNKVRIFNNFFYIYYLQHI